MKKAKSLGTILGNFVKERDKTCWRQRGRVVRAPDLKSRSRGFMSRSDHWLVILSVVLTANRSLFRGCFSNKYYMTMQNNGGKFPKKLWCCVGGSITR